MSEIILNNKITAWDRVLSDLRLSLGDTVVKSWLTSVVVESFRDGVLNLFVPTRFIKDWIQRNYERDIFAACLNHYSNLDSISFIVNAGCDRIREETCDLLSKDANALSDNGAILPADKGRNFETFVHTYSFKYDLDDMSSSLDSDYTFENFITGASNEFAVSAMKKVIMSYDNTFSPLFLSASVGLGKTHLIQSAANCIKQAFPEKKVLYLSAEKFMYKFVESLKNGDSTAFKEFFRSVDVLLIDDIQFMSGKDATQQEFLHTFDALIASGKKIILTADCSAAQLVGFDERLKSRFASGLEVNIAPADYDLRLDILQSKAKRKGFNLPFDVIEFIATRFTRSIREIEGALNRLVAHADLLNLPLNVSVAAKILKDTAAVCEKVVSVEEIQRAVAEFYGIKLSDMRSVRKQKEVALPRQVAMYLAKEMTTRSLPDIARSFDRDHATVIYAVKKIRALAASDSAFNQNLSMIKNGIES